MNLTWRRRALLLWGVPLLLAFVLFASLGVWQLQRRVWKLQLIEHTQERVNAAAMPAPGPGAWPSLTADHDEYRHVRVRGQYLSGRDTLVQAVTVRGPGFWVMTPLRTHDFVVLINRGFVPQAQRAALASPSALPHGVEAEVSGLLRMSEPGGGFLHTNDAAAGRWYSRDVVAIAATRGLRTVAPYFVDAEAALGALAAEGGAIQPVGGLTVVTFRNAHLQYALTWFGLAGLVVVGAAIVAKQQ